MKKIIHLFTVVFILSFNASANELKTFATDGCTDFVDGTIENPTLWHHCCLMHDMKYWYGGSSNNRDRADLDLKNCVQKVAGANWAQVIYLGVRAGHHSPIKNKYNWSWGWLEKRDMTELSLLEKTYVMFELNRLPVDRNYIDQVMKESFSKAKFETSLEL